LETLVSIFNFLLNKLEDCQDKLSQDLYVKNTILCTISKLKEYYPMTKELVYIVTISKLTKLLIDE
jgi:hypothetical protein